MLKNLNIPIKKLKIIPKFLIPESKQDKIIRNSITFTGQT